MKSQVGLVVAAMLVLRFVAGNDTHNSSDNDTHNSSGTTMVDVKGQSGKFTIYNSKRGISEGITVTMDALREVDANGNAVGASGSVKHSLNTFASQSFTIDDEEAVRVGTVRATKIAFSSPVSSVGIIKVDTFVIEERGEVGPPGETWGVDVGDLKWNIELSNWKWCGCSKGSSTEIGAFIDVDISVKGLGNMAFRPGSEKSIDMGSGLSMELSDQVMVDGNWTSMPDGYPKIVMQGSSTVFTFRFPSFESVATYDPLIAGMGSAGTTSDPSLEATTPTLAPSGPSVASTSAPTPVSTLAPSAPATQAGSVEVVHVAGEFPITADFPEEFIADSKNKDPIAAGIANAVDVQKSSVEVTLSLTSSRLLRVQDMGRRLAGNIVVSYAITVPKDSINKADAVVAVLQGADIVTTLTEKMNEASGGTFVIIVASAPTVTQTVVVIEPTPDKESTYTSAPTRSQCCTWFVIITASLWAHQWSA